MTLTKSQLEFVAICALIAGVGAALSGAQPTGTEWWDPLLNAAFAIAFVGAASRASRVVLVAAGGAAAALVGFTPWLIFGLGGFAAAFAADMYAERRVELQAVAGALTVSALLHLRSVGFFGGSALVAVVCSAAVAASWYRRTTASSRRRARRGVGLIVLLTVVLAAIAGVVGMSARSTANEGITAARQGLSSARAGDPQQLTAQLEVAADRLSEASDRIDSPFIKPMYLLPVAAQHVRALSVAADQGSLVAGEAAAAVIEADVGELQLRQGQFDLGLLTTMAPRLASVASQLETTVIKIDGSRSGWLVASVDRRIESLTEEVREVLPEARVAAEAAQVLPSMLGADNERRYLMLFGTPGESREFGGFVGGYALLGVDDGQLDLIRAGSINELRGLPRPDALPNPTSYPAEFVQANPAGFPQNLTNTPNFGVIARAVGDVFPLLEGAPIDGVIYADPYALGALTELAGPVWVDGLDEPLDGAAMVDFLFRGQYEIFANRWEREARFETIGAIAAATAAAFERADLPGPERLGQVLGPVARAGRLQVITTDDRENAFLRQVLLQREFIAPTSIDSVAVVQSNSTESKLDLYLRRTIHYDVRVEDDGALAAVVEIGLASDVPEDAPELTLGNTDGTNRVLLSLYSPHDIASLTVDGQRHDYVVHEEFGFRRYSLVGIELEPGAAANVRIELGGQTNPDAYRLGVWAQPLVNLDSVRVTYQRGEAEPVTEQRQLVENWVFAPEQAAN